MQPAPKPNGTQPIHEQVIEDIKRRAEVGKQNYGTYLQANNGRDSLLDAYEEAQDKALYLKQAILERDALVMELEAAREEVLELKADYQRLEEIRRDLMERCERMRSLDGLPLDEIAARQITRDRRMNLLGAAEELERIAANWYQEMVAWTATDFEQRAAQLRREVEAKGEVANDGE